MKKNTASNAEKPAFKDYYKTILPDKADTSNYDLESAYNELPYEDMQKYATSKVEHLPDTYKKPTHPTFSDESKYHNDKTPGGRWSMNAANVWVYEPSEHNIKTLGDKDKYKKWFMENEPGALLKMK